MSRRTLVVATGNAGKLAELRRLLTGIFAGDEWTLTAQSEFGIESPPETGATFIENAILKARHAAARADGPAVADDSGLIVDALGGAPGVRSARFAGDGADDDANNRKLLDALANVPAEERTARFHCAIVWFRHARDPAPLIGEGTWEGTILTAPRGTGGFGYDPLFLDPDTGRTSAELAPADKDARSHRGRALRALAAALSSPLGKER